MSQQRTKTLIYRRGEAPTWTADSAQHEDEDIRTSVKNQTIRKQRHIAKPQILLQPDKPQPPKLEEQHHTVHIEVPIQQDEDEDDEEEIARQRARLRAKALQQQQELEENDDDQELVKKAQLVSLQSQQVARKSERGAQQDDFEVVDGDDEQEDEDDDQHSQTFLKPVFIVKERRETMAERKRLEELEEAEVEERNRRQLEKQNDSKNLVLETLEREELAAQSLKDNVSDEDLPDDEDYSEDEEVELMAWKLRELARLKRDQEALIEEQKLERDKSERLRMTDKEIEEENERLGLKKSLRAKGENMKFMQKYYHGGAFFTDSDLVDKKFLERDISAATGVDRNLDRSLLPTVLQVKDFGKSSRSKCKQYHHYVVLLTAVQTLISLIKTQPHSKQTLGWRQRK
jgi:microfibrillar-associated protein 1